MTLTGDTRDNVLCFGSLQKRIILFFSQYQPLLVILHVYLSNK